MVWKKCIRKGKTDILQILPTPFSLTATCWSDWTQLESDGFSASLRAIWFMMADSDTQSACCCIKGILKYLVWQRVYGNVQTKFRQDENASSYDSQDQVTYLFWITFSKHAYFQRKYLLFKLTVLYLRFQLYFFTIVPFSNRGEPWAWINWEITQLMRQNRPK